MPNKHASPFVGWNPPGDRSAWLRAEAERRGVPLSTILNEAVDEYRGCREHPAPATRAFLAAEDEQPRPAGKNCKHRNMRGVKGVCPDCQEWVTK